MVEQNRPPKDARPDEPWGGNKDAGHYSKDGGKNSMARFTRDKEIRCNNLHEARDTIDRLGRIHAGFMHDNAFLPKDAIEQHYTIDIQKARSA